MFCLVLKTIIIYTLGPSNSGWRPSPGTTPVNSDDERPSPRKANTLPRRRWSINIGDKWFFYILKWKTDRYFGEDSDLELESVGNESIVVWKFLCDSVCFLQDNDIYQILSLRHNVNYCETCAVYWIHVWTLFTQNYYKFTSCYLKNI